MVGFFWIARLDFADLVVAFRAAALGALEGLAAFADLVDFAEEADFDGFDFDAFVASDAELDFAPLVAFFAAAAFFPFKAGCILVLLLAEPATLVFGRLAESGSAVLALA